MSCLFFFSSRRRHTRLQGDWSSDVCSSDPQWLARLYPCASCASRPPPNTGSEKRHPEAVLSRTWLTTHLIRTWPTTFCSVLFSSIKTENSQSLRPIFFWCNEAASIPLKRTRRVCVIWVSFAPNGPEAVQSNVVLVPALLTWLC